jgi:hypothetical protein
MMRIVALHPDEIPIADWLNTRSNQPPPGRSWSPGGTELLPPNELAFEPEVRDVLLDLLDLYVAKADDDQDSNPESINAALRLREKIVEAVNHA